MGSSPAKILVIEDNPADVVLLRVALDHHKEAYVLEVLRDGEEAIRFANEQRALTADPEPCVIVLDLTLPKYDGKSVLKAIKQEPVLARVRVVALSGLARASEEMEVQRLGARLYRAKPLDLDDWFVLAGEILAICRESIVRTTP